MSTFADLHIHTHYSDGTSSPEEVIEQAHACGLSCIAITDHDTIDGIDPTLEAAKKYGIEVISGVELSSEINGKDVHVLGYLFDHTDKALIARIREMQAMRTLRMKEMIVRLNEMGIENVHFEDVTTSAENRSLGRPHLAAVLKEKGIVTNVKQAFDRYLGEGAPAYVSKFKQTPAEAIRLIRSAGGVAVLAHPMFTNVDEMIAQFVREGLGGLEAYYPNCSENVITFYKNLARKYNLVVTGGSDAHGDAKKHTYIGKMRLPYSFVEELKKAVSPDV